MRAMVIGDAMIDRYLHGTTTRISPEAPVPVVALERAISKAGGAANVALNLAAWGCDTMLVCITGKDDNASDLRNILDEHGLRHHLIQVSDRPTTVKTRVVVAAHHMLRIDEESTAELGDQIELEVKNEILSTLDHFRPEMVILEDYNKGLLTSDIIEAVIHAAKAYGAYVAVDPKERHFFAYKKADLFKPNLREAGQAAGHSVGLPELNSLASDWRKAMSVNTIAITLGASGIFLQNEQEEIHARPAKTIDVVDVCGAGDAVICTLALSLMSGLSLSDAALLSNYTGAYVCSQSGVVQADPEVILAWAAE